jgi:purine-binding chemotaxis protein CheW
MTATGTTYLTLLLGSEEYGVPITQVREIIGTQPVTPVPDRPAMVDGVINLRGVVIPVISLRRAFGLGPCEPDSQNVIIVVDGGQDGRVGLAADRVSEVITFADADVEPPPRLASTGTLVSGIGKSQGRIRILLDLTHLTNDC